MRNHTYILVSGLFLCSCGGNSAEGQFSENDLMSDAEEVEVSYKEVDWDWIDTKVEQDTLVVIEGYIGPVSSMLLSSSDEMIITLHERRNQLTGLKVNAWAPFGTAPNHAHKLGEKYSQEDFKVVCDDGTIVTTKDRVKMYGHFRSLEYEKKSFQIEKIELSEVQFEESAFENAVELTADAIADTAVKELYSYIDGKVELQTSIFSFAGEVKLDLSESSFRELEEVKMYFGDSPSTVSNVPDEYGPDDLIYRDYHGNQLGRTDLVRFYGVWSRNDQYSDMGPDFEVEEVVKL